MRSMRRSWLNSAQKSAQALEPRGRGLVGLDAGGAGLGLEGQRQAVEPADEGFELEGDAGRIHLGQRLEGVEVGGDGLAQGQPLGPVDRAEAGVGGLQREQRGVHVAGELELLGGDGDGLFDLGQHPVVPAAGELLVHGLEGDLLALGFGQRASRAPTLPWRSWRFSWACRARARPPWRRCRRR
jgi:hypothetical protein